MKAVIFDLGGVVLESPLHFITEFEKARGLPENFVARVVGGYASRPDGPWQKLERGELGLEEFCQAFDREIVAMGHRMSTAEMMNEMSERTFVRPVMLEAIRRLRASQRKVAALTNNWETNDEQNERLNGLRAEFDVFVESCKVGMRKPDPRIYEMTLAELTLEARDAVFLDDIGKNLKAAKTLGMATIKVVEPVAALRELGKLLSLELVD